MPPNAEPDAPGGDAAPALLIMVPGMGIGAEDFRTQGLVPELERRHWPIRIAIVDPGADAYLDGSVEDRMLDAIDALVREAGSARIWFAGISLGCQGILRCVRRRPAMAAGLLLLTPYLASTGLMAEVVRAGGLRRWAAANRDPVKSDPAFLSWLGSTPSLPPMLVGHAVQDRFATTGTALAALGPKDCLVTVPGPHDWSSWLPLWRMMLDRNPFHPAVMAA